MSLSSSPRGTKQDAWCQHQHPCAPRSLDSLKAYPFGPHLPFYVSLDFIIATGPGGIPGCQHNLLSLWASLPFLVCSVCIRGRRKHQHCKHLPKQKKIDQPRTGTGNQRTMLEVVYVGRSQKAKQEKRAKIFGSLNMRLEQVCLWAMNTYLKFKIYRKFNWYIIWFYVIVTLRSRPLEHVSSQAAASTMVGSCGWHLFCACQPKVLSKVFQNQDQDG